MHRNRGLFHKLVTFNLKNYLGPWNVNHYIEFVLFFSLILINNTFFFIVFLLIGQLVSMTPLKRHRWSRLPQ